MEQLGNEKEWKAQTAITFTLYHSSAKQSKAVKGLGDMKNILLSAKAVCKI